MTMQYEQQNINLEVETAFKSFIYDPSAEQTDISFSDWESLLGAIQGLPGPKRSLFVARSQPRPRSRQEPTI